MKKSAIKEIIDTYGVEDITEGLPWKVKAVCHRHKSHVFLVKDKDDYVRGIKAEFTEEEINDMTREEYIDLFCENWFATCIINEDNDAELEPYHGAIFVFIEDYGFLVDEFGLEGEEVFNYMVSDIFHELGHVIHRTSNEEVADQYSIKKCGMETVQQKLYWMLQHTIYFTHGKVSRYMCEYDHRNKLIGI